MDRIAARQAGEMFETILLVPILRPLTAGCDVFGDYGVELFAQEFARSDRGGFASLLAERLRGAS